MTAIAALIHEGKVWIGGDSAGVGGYSLQVRADSKVFVNGPFVMGFTTSFRMGQLLRYAFTPPARMEGQTDSKFMSTTFIDAVRRCLKDGGFAAKDNEREEGGTFLVGYRGHLYFVSDDYQVGELADGYAAVGSGQDLVLGALYATEPSRGFVTDGPDASLPTTRIVLALSAAERFNAGVRGPFTIEVEP